MQDQGLVSLTEVLNSCVSITRDNLRVLFSNDLLHNSKVVENKKLGKALFMDGLIQSSVIDYHVYHEALVQPALILHKSPKRVLIGGGGEMLTACEVLKNKLVERCDMVDIDGPVVEMAKEQLIDLHKNAFKDDKRFNLVIGDVVEYIENYTINDESDLYDVVIMDIVDPCEGKEAAYIYTQNFYEQIKKKMKKDGIFVTQSTCLHNMNYFTSAAIRKTVEEVWGSA